MKNRMRGEAMRSHINVPFEVKQMPQEEDPNFFRFEGLASTFGNEDLGGDVVLPGAFTESLQKRKPKLLWQHEMEDVLGVFESVSEITEGLKVMGKMPKADTLVAGRVIPQMKVGAIDSMSIGFSLASDGYYMKEGIRYITKADLWEISLVTIPMNPKALIHDMKRATPFRDLPLAPRSHPWDSAAALRRVRELTGSADAPTPRYRNAFFWFDQNNEENFGSYKLPFADVIDGRLTAVPRGIFAAAAAMQGARGGVDIPDADRSAVEAHIARYYTKMEMTAPFEKSGLGVAELEAMSERDIEDLLRSSGVFSRKGATFMATKVKAALRDAAEAEVQGDPATDWKALTAQLHELNAKLKTN